MYICSHLYFVAYFLFSELYQVAQLIKLELSFPFSYQDPACENFCYNTIMYTNRSFSARSSLQKQALFDQADGQQSTLSYTLQYTTTIGSNSFRLESRVKWCVGVGFRRLITRTDSSTTSISSNQTKLNIIPKSSSSLDKSRDIHLCDLLFIGVHRCKSIRPSVRPRP